MEIKLILKHITQERFPATVADDWSGNVWSVPCCVINLGSLTRKDEVVLPAAYQGFILRAESEGGIFWDPLTNGVYRADQEAYNAMIELDRGLSPGEVARRLGIKADSVNKLVAQLDEIRRPKRMEKKSKSGLQSSKKKKGRNK